MVDTFSFTEWLESEMKARELSQSDIARIGGVTRSAINKVLLRQYNPGPEVCTAIARAFRMSPEEVFRMAGILPNPPTRSIMEERATYLFNQLPEEDQQEILKYLDYRLEQAKQREAHKKGTGPLRPTPGTG